MMGYVFMRFGTEFREDNIDRMREKLGECLQRCGIGGSQSYALLNLMDELACNVLEHSQARWIELEIHPNASDVRIILRDDGPEFNPAAQVSKGELDEAVDKGTGRNLGLYMVGQIARSWNYTRANGTVNELVLDVDLDPGDKGKA
jgi:anti-sigma regulatory factor (Ser/Thr protein kinase)